jgi:two-component system sensor histidine kinase/response regulator
LAHILVVDDNAQNRELLLIYLSSDGHEITEAASGDEALLRASESLPDLALLDIMMPGLNGFETAVRLKKLAGDEFLPVLLVSSLQDPSSRILGLKMGADDFLSKPLDRSELRARVTNLLMLRSKERELRTRNHELLELQHFRDEMSALLVHDLKNPISIVLSNVEFVSKSPRLNDEEREAIDDARIAGYRTLRLLANLLDITRSEAGRLVLRRARVKLRELVTAVIERYQRLSAGRGVTMELVIDPKLEVDVDADLVTRVIENILDNSLRFTPHQGRIVLDAAQLDAGVVFTIGNNGPPIPAVSRERIFDKFAQGDSNLRRSNIGLGLYFCRLVAEAHGGSIRVDETAELPTVFVMTLPGQASSS